jgi:hypothetical protein
LVTKDRLEAFDANNGNSHTQDWKDVPDYRTSKNEVLALADKWLKPLALYFIGLIMFLGLYIGLVVSKLLTLLIVSVLALAINNFAKKGWTFKQLINIGLFALTLPTILITALGWVGGRVNFLYSLVLLAILLAVVFTKDSKEVVN